MLTQKNEVRKILGYLPQEFGVYPKISAIDMLQHLAVMKGVTNKTERKQMVEAILNQTNLWDVRKKALSTYSGGMKQRFGIAQALLANPKLIIVDEPTAGLDPAERNRFLNLLSSIGSNVTVILSTHIVEDVRELCPRMAIISNGELLLEGAPAEALESLRGKIWSKVVATDDELRALETNFNVVSTHLIGGLHEVRVYADSSPGDGFRPVESGLEDVYFLSLAPRQELAKETSMPCSGSSSPSSSSSGSRAYPPTFTSLCGSPSASSTSPRELRPGRQFQRQGAAERPLRQYL